MVIALANKYPLLGARDEFTDVRKAREASPWFSYSLVVGKAKNSVLDLKEFVSAAKASSRRSTHTAKGRLRIRLTDVDGAIRARAELLALRLRALAVGIRCGTLVLATIVPLGRCSLAQDGSPETDGPYES